ncbi:MAG: cupin domain-containing protein [Candidatus Omnitrophota bacterium]
MDDIDYSAGAQNLDSLVEYQQGAVVSRTLIKKEAGTVTLFAFEKGEELSEHTAPFDAFVYILEGNVHIFIDKKRKELSSGQMIIMPAGRPHALKAADRFKMLLVLVKK